MWTSGLCRRGSAGVGWEVSSTDLSPPPPLQPRLAAHIAHRVGSRGGFNPPSPFFLPSTQYRTSIRPISCIMLSSSSSCFSDLFVSLLSAKGRTALVAEATPGHQGKRAGQMIVLCSYSRRVMPTQREDVLGGCTLILEGSCSSLLGEGSRGKGVEGPVVCRRRVPGYGGRLCLLPEKEGSQG